MNIHDIIKIVVLPYVKWCFRALIVGALFTGCGNDEPVIYEVQSEKKECTQIEVQACGLTLACKDGNIYQCVNN